MPPPKTCPASGQTLEKLPRHQCPPYSRGDCGDGSETTLLEHEERRLPYLFKLRHTTKIKVSILHEKGSHITSAITLISNELRPIHAITERWSAQQCWPLLPSG